MPENAYFFDRSYGPGWKCLRGYRAEGEACVKIVLPPNTHLDQSGNDWECDAPARRRQETCTRN